MIGHDNVYKYLEFFICCLGVFRFDYVIEKIYIYIHLLRQVKHDRRYYQLNISINTSDFFLKHFHVRLLRV